MAFDMAKQEEDLRKEYLHGGKSLVVRVTDNDFQREVIEKLSRLETKMDMLVGGEQPGWMQSAESRINALTRNDIKRSVYDRLVNAAITVAISVAIALRDHWGIR
jgi:hypothetical protein